MKEKKLKEAKMKMKLGATWCYLLFMLINHKYSLLASAKSLETQNLASCHEHVGDFFKSFLNVTIQPSNKVGKYSKVCFDRCSTPSRLLSAIKPIFSNVMLCSPELWRPLLCVFVYRTGNPSFNLHRYTADAFYAKFWNFSLEFFILKIVFHGNFSFSKKNLH